MCGVKGNRAALLRAGLSKKEATIEAGGDLYTEYLPVPASATPREITAWSHEPGTFGLDYFQMGKKKKSDTDDWKEGFLLLVQPISYFLQAVRIGNRSSRVSLVNTFFKSQFLILNSLFRLLH